ncbi:MAG: type II toxin-antitoxin system RelE/ParE family toxin [Hyphococcus sp.]
MIQSLKGRCARAIAAGERPKGFPHDLVNAAENKLAMIEAAATLGDLRSPPGNRLHELKGDRKGQHAIRINDQWRVCFTWKDGGADDVEIADYHD